MLRCLSVQLEWACIMFGSVVVGFAVSPVLRRTCREGRPKSQRLRHDIPSTVFSQCSLDGCITHRSLFSIPANCAKLRKFCMHGSAARFRQASHPSVSQRRPLHDANEERGAKRSITIRSHSHHSSGKQNRPCVGNDLSCAWPRRLPGHCMHFA